MSLQTRTICTEIYAIRTKIVRKCIWSEMELVCIKRMNAWRQSTRWSMKKLSQQTLTIETARVLIEDIVSRLSGQLGFLEHLESSLNNEEILTNKAIRATIKIPISSDLLDWKGHAQKGRLNEKTMHEAKKAFRGLRMLHSDTILSTKQLLSAESIWSNFDYANKSLIVSAVDQIRSRHATTMETMSELVLALRSCSRLLPNETLELFLRGRYAVQILCDHYIALNKRPCHGAVSIDCCLEPVLEEAATEAKHICDAHYLVKPEISLPPV